MSHLKPERVKQGLYAIHEWALKARTQAAVHILPLLALLEKGAGACVPTEFEESDDFDFWDRYLLIAPDDPKPYFTPISLRCVEKGFPHSNAATVRKNTFELKWRAGSRSTYKNGNTLWTLAENYADIIREKVLTKGGATSNIPVLDLAVILFRNEKFPEDATAETILNLFRARFEQNNQDFSTLFSYHSEPQDVLFTKNHLDIPTAYNQLILENVVPEKTAAPRLTGVHAPEPLEDLEDPVLIQVQQILSMGSSGIIFSGPPGTGKTWYAQRIAATLVDDPKRNIFRVQFHPSYGYEDFIEGYKPDDSAKSGFSVVKKKFLDACHRASNSDGYVVFIIDEINRGDPARIFGELLTYIESQYRGEEFSLPFSGRTVHIPETLLLLATMNPFDRSVAQVDAAFVRRFDHIDLEPSGEVVETMLEKLGGFSGEQISAIVSWFEAVQQILPIGLGHSFFKDVTDLDRLKLIWKYRILPAAKAILELNPERTEDFMNSYTALIQRLERAEAPE